VAWRGVEFNLLFSKFGHGGVSRNYGLMGRFPSGRRIAGDGLGQRDGFPSRESGTNGSAPRMWRWMGHRPGR
jgi:hypothetical protein